LPIHFDLDPFNKCGFEIKLVPLVAIALQQLVIKIVCLASDLLRYSGDISDQLNRFDHVVENSRHIGEVEMLGGLRDELGKVPEQEVGAVLQQFLADQAFQKSALVALD
jgi:hypothetical protein